MAKVYLGRQEKLDRAVALKRLGAAAPEPEAIDRLLREARITGRLEHPNIVPVHDIITGPDGLPQVVLKRIEGDTWSALLADPQRIQGQFGAEDVLAWNLEVLMAVARALSFAHSRRVIHRDVKPSNVMIGAFGEIYLLDWGIALDLDEPPSQEQTEPSGTNGYMAPEQVGHHGGALGPWTDTYLLGATLYRLVTGRPPHAGRTLVDRALECADGPPEVPDHVPAELSGIIRRALDPLPARRTPTPESFRREVAAFLTHRAARRLASRGDRERARAERLRHDATAFESHSLAADLAYRAALEEWPECDQAQRGRSATQALRVEHALESDDLRLARRLASTSESLPASLRERLRAAMRQASARAEKLERLVRDADRELGHRARGLFGGVFLVFWIGFWGTVAFSPPSTVWPLVGFCLGVLGLGLGLTRLGAPQLYENRINRTSIAVVVSGLLLLSVWLVGAAQLGLPMTTIITGYLFVCALFTSGMATLMDPWGAVSAAGFAAAFLVAATWPTSLPFAVLGGNGVMLLNQLVLNYLRGRRGFDSLPAMGSLPP